MTLDPIFGQTISFGLSMLFMLAALDKLQHHEAFVGVLKNYALLPTQVLRFSAFAIALAEGFIAFGLMLDASRETAALFAASVLGVYALAMALTLKRGLQHVDCGCTLGEGGGINVVSKGLIYRNIAMTLIALSLIVPISQRALTITDIVAIAFGVLVLGLCYATINQLIANHHRYQDMT